MTDETTRIPIPTNGHGRTDRAAPDAPASPRSVPPGVAAAPDLRIAVTPAQVATGFAVIAGIIGIVLGLRRRRGR